MKFNIIGVLFGISVVERTPVSLKNKGNVMATTAKESIQGVPCSSCQ
jgi:hypothetical protein